MALPRQIFEINYAKGLDTKTDPKAMVPGSLTNLENGVFEKGGRISKRDAFTDLGTSGLSDTQTAHTLVTAGDKLGMIDGDGLWTWVSSLSKWIQTNQPLIYEAGVKETDAPDFRTARVDVQRVSGTLPGQVLGYEVRATVAVENGLAIYAWTISNGTSASTLYAVVVDVATGELVLGPTYLTGIASAADEYNPHLVVYGDGASVGLWTHDRSGNLYFRLFDATVPTAWGARTTVKTDLHTTGPLLDVTTDGLSAWVVYRDNNATPRIHVLEITKNLVIGTDLTYAQNATDALACYYHPSAGRLFIGYATSGGAAMCVVMDPNTEVFSGPTSVFGGLVGTRVNNIGIAQRDATTVYFFDEETANGTTPQQVRWRPINTSAATSSYAMQAYRLGLAAKPVYYSTLQETFVVVTNDSDTQPAWILCRPYIGRQGAASADGYLQPIARLRQDVTPGYRYANHLGEVVTAESASQFIVACPTRTEFERTGGAISYFFGLEGFKFDFATTAEPLPRANTHGAALIGGGLLTHYGGTKVWEHAPMFAPVIVSTSSGAGTLANGTYSYKAVYEYEDELGEVHRSGESEASEITGGGTITIRVSACAPSYVDGDSQNGGRIVLYRTKSNGTIWYRVGSTGWGGVDVSRSITDDTSDDDLVDNEILYTTGGIASNDCPPGAVAMCAAKDRVWLVSNQDRREVWYSKRKAQGVAFEFSATQVIRVPEDATAVAEMDDKIVIFTERAIYAVIDGVIEQVGVPERISSDVGCSNWESVVLSPLGLFFKSAKGIYLLDRGMGVKYIGAPVEDYNSIAIMSAVLIDDKNQVRFTLQNTTRMLVYDYFFEQWSTFTGTPMRAVDSVIWDGVHVTLSRVVVGLDGYAILPMYEVAGLYKDRGTTFISLSLATGWLKVAGMQGWQRIERALFLGTSESAHGLQVSYYYDYDDSTSDTFNLADVDVDAFDRTQWDVRLPRQKLQALKIALTDTEPLTLGGTFQGMTISGLALEVAIKGKLARLPAAMKTG